MTKKHTPKESTINVLVVDDDKVARETVIDYLKSFGYTKIFHASDGAEALNILNDEKIDLVISDWEMPSTNGIELLQAIKSADRYHDLPFIMITSPVSQERNKIETAAAAKVDGYIIKPFRSEVLRQKIEQAWASASQRHRGGVLVVDDDDGSRATIVEYLKTMGHTPIFEARDGAEAFASLQLHSKEIELMISDWEMPKLAGIELLRQVRNTKEFETLPFIMVTSQTSIERIKLKQALDADVDNYLLKPFRVDDLRNKVEEVLHRSKEASNVQASLEKGADLLNLMRYGEAIKVFKKVIQEDAKNYRAYIGLAQAQRRMEPDKVTRATQYARAAVTLNPFYDRGYIELALIFEGAMSLGKAIACVQEGLESCPKSALLHYHLGRLLIRRGDDAAGIKELQAALALNPNLLEAKELLEGRK